MTELWYRISDDVSGSFNEDGDLIGSFTPALRLDKYTVKRYTPKGVVLSVRGRDRFCLIKSNKRFACPTIEEAVESYKARKTKQIQILKSNLERAERYLSMINVVDLSKIMDLEIGRPAFIKG